MAVGCCCWGAVNSEGTDGLRPGSRAGKLHATPGGLSPFPPGPAAPSAVGRHLCCHLNNAADNHAKHRCPAPGQGCLPRAPPSCLFLLRRPRPVRKAACLSPPAVPRKGRPACRAQGGGCGRASPRGARRGARQSPASFLNLVFLQILFPCRGPRRRCIWASNPAHSCARALPPSICLFVFLGLSLQAAILYKQNYPFKASRFGGFSWWMSGAACAALVPQLHPSLPPGRASGPVDQRRGLRLPGLPRAPPEASKPPDGC